MITDQTKNKLAAIERLIASGTPVTKALKEVRLSPSIYYKNRERPKKRSARRKVTVTEIHAPVVSPKAFVFYGEPAQIAEIVRGLL